MAANDIYPKRPGSGGTLHMTAYPLDAGQTFETGEPVVVGATGELAECGSDPAAVTGISGSTSQGKDVRGVDGTRPTGTLISVYTATDEHVYESENFATDGSGTAATPTLANVGDQAGFIRDGNGDWYVDTGAGNAHVEIIEVADSIGRTLGNPTDGPGTGVKVRFVFL